MSRPAETQVIEGDCIEAMAAMPEASVDAIVTDPPYGLGFMGREWDALPPGLPWARECLRVLKPGGHLLAFGGTRTYHRLACAIEDAGFEIRDCLAWLYGQGFPKGTACLKPGHEPITLARKDRKGTLNVDACRLAPGRWPANVLLDSEAAAMLDEQSGDRASHNAAGSWTTDKPTNVYGHFAACAHEGYGDSGGASRFFYCAKASTRERGAGLDTRNAHPTVKPIDLMRWLVRLVTPPGGTVLDPFAGSGTTGCAAALEGVDFIGIEREAEYVQTARSRIAHWSCQQLEMAA